MSLNRIALTDDYSDPDMIAALERVKNSGYTGESITLDYVYKWSRLLYCLNKVGKVKDKTILDLGGGLSPIQWFAAIDGARVINLDIGFTGSWFYTVDMLYQHVNPTWAKVAKSADKRITRIAGDIYATIAQLESESIDIAIDVCAMHTFLEDPATLLNQIKRVLKPGGHLISVGDVANPIARNDNHFRYPQEYADLLVSGGLKLLEPYDYQTWEPFLTQRENAIARGQFNPDSLDLKAMFFDPASIPYGNVPSYPIYIWVATYILQKETHEI